jgi:hypothetical protein
MLSLGPITWADKSCCGKSFGVQRHDDIGSPSFSARADGIISGIGRDVWQSRRRNKFRLLSQQIDYLPNELTPDAYLSKTRLYSRENLIAHQPDKRIPIDPVPEYSGAWILGSDL